MKYVQHLPDSLDDTIVAVSGKFLVNPCRRLTDRLATCGVAGQYIELLSDAFDLCCSIVENNLDTLVITE